MYRNPPLDFGKYAISVPTNSNGLPTLIGLNLPCLKFTRDFIFVFFLKLIYVKNKF
jgi:hypothetical protein